MIIIFSSTLARRMAQASSVSSPCSDSRAERRLCRTDVFTVRRKIVQLLFYPECSEGRSCQGGRECIGSPVDQNDKTNASPKNARADNLCDMETSIHQEQSNMPPPS